jgi:hypothetical protein
MGWKFGRTTLTHFSVSSPSQNFRSVVSNLHQNFRSLFCNYSWEKNSSFPSRLLLLHFPFFFLGFFYHFSTGVGIGFRWELRNSQIWGSIAPSKIASRSISCPSHAIAAARSHLLSLLLEFHFQFKKKKKNPSQIPTPQPAQANPYPPKPRL